MRFKDDLQRELYYRSQIDYCYFMLEKIATLNLKTKIPIEIMIDKVIGYDKTKTNEYIDNSIYFINVMIRCKKKLGYDIDENKKMLAELKKIKNKNLQKQVLRKN